MSVRWHADPEDVARYGTGDLDEARADSLEAHLLTCEECRTLVSPLVDRDGLVGIWAEIEEAIDAPNQGILERVLIRLRVPDHLARILAATPSLRLSWFAAVAVALVFVALSAHGDHAGLVVFLVMAPLVPVAGVAAAFGPGMDPTYEIGLAAPLRGSRLLLLRSAAVLVASLGIAGIAALALPQLDWTAAAWLLPALALTLLCIALSTVADPVRSAAGVAIGWIVVVTVAGLVAGDGVAAFRLTGQVLCLVLVAAAGLILARRSDAFEWTVGP